jgi:hypothetical protein
MTPIDETLLSAGFAGYRGLEPSDAEVARVVLRAAPRRRSPLRLPVFRPGRPVLAGAAVAALLLGGAYAVPTTRAAIDSVTGSIASTFGAYQRGGDAEAPGRPLGKDEAAPFYDRTLLANHDPRVIAEAGGYKLYAYISTGGSISFLLGETGVGMGYPSAFELSQGAIYVLGPGALAHADAQGQVPLFGIGATSVASVELEYASGPPLRLDGVDDGWVLLAEPAREPQAIVARDAAGNVLERKSVAYITWPQYTR